MITRKNFIITAACIAAESGVIGRGLKNASADDTADTEVRLSSHEMEILQYATLAPSGHNAQPWELRIKNAGEWDLGISTEKILPVVDPHNREAKLSIGAFLANLKLASSVYGYNAEIDFNRKSGGWPLAGISLKPTPVSADKKILTLIENRYTHRGGLGKDDLTSADIKNLTRGNPRIIYIPEKSAHGRIISEGTIEANRSQAMRRDAVIELSQWIRWSDADASKQRNGITPESMGISGFPLWFVKKFYGPDDVLKPGFIEKTVESAAAAVKNCGGWIIITSDKTDNSSLIKTGMLFEDIFLKSRSLGIGIHPMTQILEEQGFRENINSQLGIKENIQFIIRTGYADKFRPYRKLRLTPAQFIIKSRMNK